MKSRIGRGLSLSVGAVLMVACAAATGVVGCAADTGSSSSSKADGFKDGLTILSADKSGGVSAAYKANGRVVFLETKVGQLKEKPYLEAFPNEPDHEFDARVVDQEGRTFRLILGGDNFIDQTWAADILASGHITTKAEGVLRAADFALARDGANEFAAQAGPELADHVYHLTNMTHVVPQEDPEMIAGGAKADLSLPTERPYSVNGCSTNLQQGMLWTIPLGSGEGALGSILGDIAAYVANAVHSSVTSWNYNGCAGTWDQNTQACNHGTCAGNSGMTAVCSSYSGMTSATARSYGDNPVGWGGGWSGWNSNDLFSYLTITSGAEHQSCTTGSGCTSGGGCSSGYGIDIADINVYGYDDPNHCCHDDSARELDEVRNERNDSRTWSGGNGGWNGSFACNHNTTFFGQWESDIQPPNCP